MLLYWALYTFIFEKKINIHSYRGFLECMITYFILYLHIVRMVSHGSCHLEAGDKITLKKNLVLINMAKYGWPTFLIHEEGFGLER